MGNVIFFSFQIELFKPNRMDIYLWALTYGPSVELSSEALNFSITSVDSVDLLGVKTNLFLERVIPTYSNCRVVSEL
ncbi:MAG: hypothetical protein EU541_02850 [Promethearchaeota archaeon]|nr:MAG: hypothetical protein EU541_02850 [Candidatus Lokiarchaeota archaeon]